MEKSFQELDLSNSFLFAAALEDPETCQIVLEIILDCKLSKVRVHAEHSILVSSDFRSVRLDVYASDETQVSYNLEAQNDNEGNLPQRSRFHQALMDVYSLKPGQDFRDLKPSFVVFICTFDPFGEKLYRYTFEERCLEREFALGDGTRKIFLNTRGQNVQEVPQELIHFLHYMEHSTDEYVSQVSEKSITRLHKRVTRLKQRRELEAQYMTVEDLIRSRERKAMTAGKAEGKAEAILELLEERESISGDLRRRILEEKNIEVLNRWVKLAAKAQSVDDFEKQL